jgi:hypothetical protein
LINLKDEEGYVQTKVAGKKIPGTSATHPSYFLKTTQRVGSIKGPLNYTQDQNCFSHWDDPIHDGTKTQQVVRQVRDAIDKDILGTK